MRDNRCTYYHTRVGASDGARVGPFRPALSPPALLQKARSPLQLHSSVEARDAWHGRIVEGAWTACCEALAEAPLETGLGDAWQP